LPVRAAHMIPLGYHVQPSFALDYQQPTIHYNYGPAIRAEETITSPRAPLVMQPEVAFVPDHTDNTLASAEDVPVYSNTPIPTPSRVYFQAMIESEAELDTEADAESEALAEVDAEADAEVDAEAEAEAETETEVEVETEEEKERRQALEEDLQNELAYQAETAALAEAEAKFEAAPPLPAEQLAQLEAEADAEAEVEVQKMVDQAKHEAATTVYHPKHHAALADVQATSTPATVVNPNATVSLAEASVSATATVEAFSQARRQAREAEAHARKMERRIALLMQAAHIRQTQAELDARDAQINALIQSELARDRLESLIEAKSAKPAAKPAPAPKNATKPANPGEGVNATFGPKRLQKAATAQPPKKQASQSDALNEAVKRSKKPASSKKF